MLQEGGDSLMDFTENKVENVSSISNPDATSSLTAEQPATEQQEIKQMNDQLKADEFLVPVPEMATQEDVPESSSKLDLAEEKETPKPPENENPVPQEEKLFPEASNLEPSDVPVDKPEQAEIENKPEPEIFEEKTINQSSQEMESAPAEPVEEHKEERPAEVGEPETKVEVAPTEVVENPTELKNDEPKIEPNQDPDGDTDAVLAVVAAVEQAQKTGPTDPAKTGSLTPKRKAPKPASSSSGGGLNTSDSGSPSSQKRRKKDPSAPKAPLNGYLVYFNEERAGMRAQNPNIGFGELTKVIAAKWKELPTEAKKKYIDEADHDKERYEKEMASYKKSDAYKQFLKDDSISKMMRNETAFFADANSRQPGSVNLNAARVYGNEESPNLAWLQNESNVAGFDVPIFTEEFMEHSKSREKEIRQLRKEVSELEKQNELIQKNIESMKKSLGSVENESSHLQAQNDQMQKNVNIFRQTILNCFKSAGMNGHQERIELDNLDEHILKMSSILKKVKYEGPPSDESQIHLVNYYLNVKSMISKINFSQLYV